MLQRHHQVFDTLKSCLFCLAAVYPNLPLRSSTVAITQGTYSSPFTAWEVRNYFLDLKLFLLQVQPTCRHKFDALSPKPDLTPNGCLHMQPTTNKRGEGHVTNRGCKDSAAAGELICQNQSLNVSYRPTTIASMSNYSVIYCPHCHLDDVLGLSVGV